MPTSPGSPSDDLAILVEGAGRWARMTAPQRRRLLVEVVATVAATAARWATAGAKAKGIDGTPQAGEEWISGPWAVLYALRRYGRTLDQIVDCGEPRLSERRIERRPDGRTVARVFPVTAADRVLFMGISAEVWMQDGVTPESLSSTLGAFYRATDSQGRVALVLGAGNISSIGPLDVLYKLIGEGAVCLLKLNPVNDYLAPILNDALAPLIREGFLRIVCGDAQVGRMLCADLRVGEIHVTGSERTHDAIVFGEGPDAPDRKRRNDPLLAKLITSELGNVSPTIVLPGPWSSADFRFQAEHIVTQKLHNGGFNCIAAQVLVLPADWDGTPRLIAQIEDLARELAPRPQYYPGVARRREALTAGRGTSSDVLSIVHVDRGDLGLVTEAFCNVLFVTTIPGEIERYVESAVGFANNDLAGTLGANVIVHPTTARRHADALDRAIERLRYGCIGVNIWTGTGYFLAETPWGAYPGATPDAIGSGIGVVHNAHLFSASLKSVVRGPFRPFPRPAWFVTNRIADRLGPALCAYEAAPSFWRAVRVVALALRA
jgi:aldehyde dehydrogenase (NAD(P)+)